MISVLSSAPILRIWNIWGVGQSHAMVAIRKHREGFEVVEGEMRFSGCSHGRGGHHTGYSWQRQIALLDSEAAAEACVAEHYPNRSGAERDLQKLRERRGR